jgi:hypothetical protein
MKHTRGRAIRMAASRWGFTSRRPRERDAELEAHPADARDARALAPDASKRRATRRGRARERDGEKPWEERDCRLVLEDGSVWNGRSFGAKATQVGEVVFNTSLSGYVTSCARVARARGAERDG